MIEVSATTVAEAAAFVGACIESLPEHERDSLWARAIWVDSSAGLRAIAVADRPLIVIPSGDRAVTGAQHHFIRSCTRRSSGAGNAIESGRAVLFRRSSNISPSRDWIAMTPTERLPGCKRVPRARAPHVARRRSSRARVGCSRARSNCSCGDSHRRMGRIVRDGQGDRFSDCRRRVRAVRTGNNTIPIGPVPADQPCWNGVESLLRARRHGNYWNYRSRRTS